MARFIDHDTMQAKRFKSLDVKVERLRKRLEASEKLIDGWNFEHNNKRDHCCKVLASGASECTCGLWEAERNYQALVAKQRKNYDN